MEITRDALALRLREERNYRLEAYWLAPVPADKRAPRLYSNAECRQRVYGEAFAPFAWPGGFDIEYITRDGDTLCAECAHREVLDYRGSVYAEVYYEGATEYCADCGAEIESAYGDPDAEEGNDDV